MSKFELLRDVKNAQSQRFIYKALANHEGTQKVLAFIFRHYQSTYNMNTHCFSKMNNSGDTDLNDAKTMIETAIRNIL